MQERVFSYPKEDSYINIGYKLNTRAKDISTRAATVIDNIDAVLGTANGYIDRKNALFTNKSGSEAFSLNYDQSISREALYEDIVSYLGEYRFEVPEYRYKQRFSRTATDSSLRLRGEKDDTPMIILGDNAIEDKIQNGEGIGKVQADLIGMRRVEKMVAEAKTGDRILYASPPDPQYGYTYGFLYDGKVEELENGEKTLHLRALRIDNAEDVEAFNTALTKITGTERRHATPNDFIENPEHIEKPISDTEINSILQSVFQFETGGAQFDKFKSNIDKMKPYISGVIDLIKNGAPLAQIQRAFHALENYALSLKEALQQSNGTVVYEANSQQSSVEFRSFITKFGYEPPKVQGSCGSSGGRSSNNIFGTGSIFSGATRDGRNSNEDEHGGLTFECPHCHRTVTRSPGVLYENCPLEGCGESVRC